MALHCLMIKHFNIELCDRSSITEEHYPLFQGTKMGIDLATYRCRIGWHNNAGLRSTSGSTVETVDRRGVRRCSVLLFLTIGVVSFIGILLLAHGVESNPGPENIFESGNDSCNTMEVSSALGALHNESKNFTNQRNLC